MKLNEWRKGRTFTVELPSGLTVTMRRVTLQTLMLTGQIPKPVLSAVKQLNSGSDTVTLGTFDAILANYDKLPIMVELMNLVCKSCIIDPPVADVADDEHIAVSEMEYSDREYIFNLISREGVDMTAPFSGEHVGSSDAGFSRTTILAATVADDGHSG